MACIFNPTYQSEGRKQADVSEFNASLVCILSKVQANVLYSKSLIDFYLPRAVITYRHYIPSS